MDNEISILVVEDEGIIAQHIKMLLQDFGYNLSGVFTKFQKAVSAIEELKFDLLLTDINLGEGIDVRSGLQLASLAKKKKDCPVIFLTAFSDKETIKKATALAPSAYLVKPVNAANLFAAIQLAMENFVNNKIKSSTEEQETATYFFVKQGSDLVKILWADVYYLESVKNYVRIKSSQQSAAVLVRGSLKQVLQDMLPPTLEYSFIKINRSEVIAKEAIQRIEKGFVETSFGKFKLGSEFEKSKL